MLIWRSFSPRTLAALLHKRREDIPSPPPRRRPDTQGVGDKSLQVAPSAEAGGRLKARHPR